VIIAYLLLIFLAAGLLIYLVAQLIQPVSVVSKDGEVTLKITLDLNINVTTNGPQVSVSARPSGPEPKTEEKVAGWTIPEFGVGERLQFGKVEKNERTEG
jgi:hypothetical protein